MASLRSASHRGHRSICVVVALAVVELSIGARAQTPDATEAPAARLLPDAFLPGPIDELDDRLEAGPERRIGPEADVLLVPDDVAADPIDDVPAADIPPIETQSNEAEAASTAPATAAPKAPAALSPGMQALRDKIRGVLTLYYPRHLNSRDHSAWEVMHGIIAYGVDTQLFRSQPGGEKITAVGWLCYNGPCRGEQMLYLDGQRLVARRGPGVQGHNGQFLAILAQSHVKRDYPLLVGGKSFTLDDLIEHEMRDCQAGEELTFKLIGLSHYLDSDATWKSHDGQNWSIERLVREELRAPIRGAACGGTHRLMGLTYSVKKRAKAGKDIEGDFQRAQTYLADYHRYTFSLQNPDGSFSTQWFVRGESDPSLDRRLKTTGHVAEWLSFSLSNEELAHPKMVQAIDYLATIMQQNPSHSWEIGPLGHAIHALSLYDGRAFAPLDPAGSPTIAERAAKLARQKAAGATR